MRPVIAEFLPSRPLHGGVSNLLIGGLVLLNAYLAYSAWDATAQRRALEAQVERARAELVRLESERITGSQPKPRTYSGDAAAIAALAGFRTDAVLANIESARVQGVRVRSLEINAASAVVRLEISATDQDLVQRYLTTLNREGTPLTWTFVQSRLGGSPADGTHALLEAHGNNP